MEEVTKHKWTAESGVIMLVDRLLWRWCPGISAAGDMLSLSVTLHMKSVLKNVSVGSTFDAAWPGSLFNCDRYYSRNKEKKETAGEVF